MYWIAWILRVVWRVVTVSVWLPKWAMSQDEQFRKEMKTLSDAEREKVIGQRSHKVDIEWWNISW